ncbi:MAG: outer membrane protein transport protein [Nitrospirae bacterium]|nr:outer membrane protein transport protein [Nitrospirota bacterium]
MVFAFRGIAGADEYHYTNILIGERPAGMGGAYTAVSDDAPGMYYNPAGIAYQSGGNLSASVNAFYISNKVYEHALGKHDWERSSSSLLPNFFGIVQPLSKGVVGFSYAVPDSITEDQDQVFTDLTGSKRYMVNVNQSDTTYLFGPSYSLMVSDSFSVGGTLYLHYRSMEKTANFENIFTDTNKSYDWSNMYVESHEMGLRPILGIMWSPQDAKYSVGVSVAQTILLTSDYDLQTSRRNSDTGLFERLEESSGKKRAMPLKIAVGCAYFPSPYFLITADATYFSSSEATEDSNPKVFAYNTDSGPLVTSIRSEQVLNLAVGTEYYLSSSAALRAGLFTNFANTPKVSSGNSNSEENIDLYGGSLSYSMFSKSTSLTFGATYSYGSGKSRIVGGSAAIQDVKMNEILLFMGTSYTY